MNILEYLRSKNIGNIPSPCGGKGTCGKCRVTIVNDKNGKNDKIGTEITRQQVLACQTEYEEGMTIILPGQYSENDMAIVDTVINPETVSGKITDNAQEACDNGKEELAAACDIGTTTVACHLLSRKTGRTLVTTAYPNVQRSYGADVISRIEAAKNDKLEEMRVAITGQIQQMINECLSRCGRENQQISQLVIAGNTVMCHLFTGLSPESIGRAPFMPQEYFGRNYKGGELGFANVDDIYIMPAVSGYVGGDITSDMLYIDMYKTTACIQNTGASKSDTTGQDILTANELQQNRLEHDKQDTGKLVQREKDTLILDIGTNGEMVLGKSNDYTCCATAAGPAFEGAEIELGMSAVSGAISRVWIENDQIQVEVIGADREKGQTATAKGICGSGLIDALYVFLCLGLIDETGRIKTHRQVSYKYHRYLGDDEEENDCIFLTDEVYITQDDIRKLQLAKGAVAAGIAVLMEARGLKCDDIGQVFIAGGFGSVLDKRSAAGIGMIPAELVDRTVAIGNAAAGGAIIAATNPNAEKRLDEIAQSMKYIELSSDKNFSDEYIRQMNLGEMKWND